MPISCQKHLFSLDEGVHYLNCSYMSPLLKSVEEAGIDGLRRKRNPFRIAPVDFFTEAETVRERFAQLIGAEAQRVALVPSVSYGMAAVARNVRTRHGQEVLTVADEFPSDVYTLQRLCQERDLDLKVVRPPVDGPGRGAAWNEAVLDAISEKTALVMLSIVHWADGTRFDLEAITRRAHEVGAVVAVDGTQSVGALPFDVRSCPIDALVCGSYKWLLGPYSLGVAWYGPYFDGGVPLEESWMNRVGSDDFQRLIEYEVEYRSSAARYNVGETSNFIHVPMLRAALEQLLDWTPTAVQDYCRDLTAPLLAFCAERGIDVEEADYRAEHLLGLRVPASLGPPEELAARLRERNVIVSVRGNSVRISPHLYNDAEDVDALITALTK